MNFAAVNKTHTRTAAIFMDENDVLHIVPFANAYIDYEDALDNNLVINHLTVNKPVLKIIYSDQPWRMDKKARDFVAQKEIKEKTIARAIVRNSIIDKVLLSFFIQLNKPEVPTKVFTRYNEAYEWLLEHKRQH